MVVSLQQSLQASPLFLPFPFHEGAVAQLGLEHRASNSAATGSNPVSLDDVFGSVAQSGKAKAVERPASDGKAADSNSVTPA